MQMIALSWKFVIVLLKSRMEYRFSFFMDFFVNIFTHTVNFLGIWIILNRFQMINGWFFFEVLFLYNLNLTTFGIAALFVWMPMMQLERMINTGEFDSVLTKPISPMFNIMLLHFHYNFLAHIFLGIIVFVICSFQLQFVWSADTIVNFIGVMIGGVLIQGGLLVICGSLGFWIMRSTAVVDMLVWNVRKFLDYPLSIYNRWIQIILTFVLPYAFVSFLPSIYFFGKKEDVNIGIAPGMVTLIVGILVFAIAFKLWKTGIGRYQSSGN